MLPPLLLPAEREWFKAAAAAAGVSELRTNAMLDGIAKDPRLLVAFRHRWHGQTSRRIRAVAHELAKR